MTARQLARDVVELVDVAARTAFAPALAGTYLLAAFIAPGLVYALDDRPSTRSTSRAPLPDEHADVVQLPRTAPREDAA